MTASLRPALRRYLVLVVVLGGAAGFLVVSRTGAPPGGRGVDSFVLIAAAIVTELFPLRVPFRDGVQEVSVSTTFVFALILLGDLPGALAAQVAAAALTDLVTHKPWWKAMFNGAQYALTVAASGAVFVAASDGSVLAPGGLPGRTLAAGIVAAVVFYVANNLFVCSAIGFASGSSPIAVIRHDLLFQAPTNAVLFSQSVPVLLVLHRSPLLIPLFLPPLLAAYHSARSSMQRDHQALHQALSGLPNRDFFRLRIDRLLEESDAHFAVLVLDLDRFHAVNDTLGHVTGDRLLIETGRRLAAAAGPDDFVAHLGGDEYGILAPLGPDRSLDEVVSTIRGALQEPFDLDGLPVLLEGGLGAAVAPDHGTDTGILLQRADVARHAAKQRASRFEPYREAIDGYDPRRLALLGELREALAERQLVVHLQPKVAFPAGHVIGAEALVRWDHPRYGLVYPDEFIDAAEATGLIDPLTDYVVDEALRQCAQWRRVGRRLSVAVNVSARSLHDEDLANRLAQQLEAHHLSPDALVIEVTESAAMQDPDVAVAVLSRVRALGVRIALDDFGTGHASLAHLQRLPIDELKIDKSFVLAMATSPADAAIVASTIGLAHSLGMKVVAEGVESEASWCTLADLGCDVAQGYFISRPVAATRFATWLVGYEGVRLAQPDPNVAGARPATGDTPAATSLPG